jgi:Rrf2 family cysteine metabolism transcriptional repressor
MAIYKGICLSSASKISFIYIMSIDLMYYFLLVSRHQILTASLVMVAFLPMKVSVRGEYALRALLVLGLRYGEGVVRIQTISDQQNIPKKFLEQILNDLKSLGAVESRRGAAGGYRLARPPQNITLASVVRHIEGALAPVSCVSDRFYERCTCPNEALCPIRDAMKEVRQAIVAVMEKMTVADLCERSISLAAAPAGTLDYVI